MQFFGTRLDTFLQTRGKFAAPHQLLFQSWRELILLREAGRKVPLIFGIPPADGFFFMVLIVVVGMLVIIVTVVFIVTFAVAVAIILSPGDRGICADQERTQCPGNHPSHEFHALLRKKTGVFERNVEQRCLPFSMHLRVPY